MGESSYSTPLLPADTRRRHKSPKYAVTYQHADGGSVTLSLPPSEEETRERTVSAAAPLPDSCYTINTFLFFLSCFQLLNLLTMTYTASVLNFIAKRFHIPSTMSSFIPSSYEIGNLVVIIPISHYGNKFNRPKAIGVGVMIMILGQAFCALPHFILPTAKVESIQDTALCYDGGFNISSDEILQQRSTMLVMPNNLPCNENSSTQNPAVLLIIGVFIGITLMGPVFGYFLGSISSAVYVNIHAEGLKQSDPSYIGAWWLGYVIICVLLAVLLFPFYFYPRSLPISKQKQAELEEIAELQKRSRESRTRPVVEEHRTNGDNSAVSSDVTSNADCPTCDPIDEDKQSGCMILFAKVKDIICDTKDLISKPMVITPIISYTAMAIIISGVVAFGPTYVQMEFSVLRTTSDLLIGGVCVPAGILGVIVGAAIMKRYNFDIRQTLIYIISMAVVCIVFLSLTFACGCPMQPLAGLAIPYSGELMSSGLSTSCNDDCYCPSGQLDLICGSDNVTYVSPCYAGCKYEQRKQASIFDAGVLYMNCSCWDGGHAVSGPCNTTECSAILGAFVVLTALAIFFICLCQAPLYVVLLRTLQPDEKAFGIGLMSFVSVLLGSIPGPIWYGMILDRSCIYWSAKCRGKKMCLLYHTDGLRFSFFGMTIAVAIAYCLVFVISFSWMEYHKDRYEKAALEEESEISVNSENPKKVGAEE